MNETFANQFKMPDTSKAEVILEAVVARNYIVGTVSESGTVSFAANPVIHKAKGAAQAEAKRLAELSPGKAFFLAQLAGGYLVPKVIGCHEF